MEQYYEEVAQDGSFKEFRRTGVYAFRIEVPEYTDKVCYAIHDLNGLFKIISEYETSVFWVRKAEYGLKERE